MPPSVRVAVGLLALLAVLLLLNAGLTWFGRATVVDRIVAAQPTTSPADAERVVVLGLIPYLVIGVLAAASVVGLPRRRAWARWTGLAAALPLGLLTVWSMVAVGGATVVSLLVLVLSVAAVSSLLARPTADWFRARAHREG